MKRPAGNNADEWAVFLEEYGVPGERIPYICVQIACAIDDAELRGTSTTPNPAAASGPNLGSEARSQYVEQATVRNAGDAWHIECRFRDGQKYAGVTVEYEWEGLAHEIADFLSGRTPTSAGPSLVAAETEGAYRSGVALAEAIKKTVNDRSFTIEDVRYSLTSLCNHYLDYGLPSDTLAVMEAERALIDALPPRLTGPQGCPLTLMFESVEAREAFRIAYKRLTPQGEAQTKGASK